MFRIDNIFCLFFNPSSKIQCRLFSVEGFDYIIDPFGQLNNEWLHRRAEKWKYRNFNIMFRKIFLNSSNTSRGPYFFIHFDLLLIVLGDGHSKIIPLCTIFMILLTLWNSEQKNGLLIKKNCFFIRFWWNLVKL